MFKGVDPDYKPVADIRYMDDYPGAKVIKDVNIGAEGEILPLQTGTDKPVIIRVNLSYIPKEPEPILVLPSESDYKNGKMTQEQKKLFVLEDTTVNRYRALFEAVNNLNNEEEQMFAKEKQKV